MLPLKDMSELFEIIECEKILIEFTLDLTRDAKINVCNDDLTESFLQPVN